MTPTEPEKMETDVSFLSPLAVAYRWSISAKTLERWRSLGTGPAWHQFGDQIRYRYADIEAFELQSRHEGGRS